MNSITPTPPMSTPPPKRTRYAPPTPTPKKEMGLGQRMELVIFGLIFAGIPLYFILPIASKPIWTFFQTARWETTPCVVTQSRPVENKNDTQFSVEFTYEYTTGGHKFTAQNVGIETKKISGTLAETKLWSDQHPVGKETTCVVNPAAPQEALLERKFPWAALGGCAFIMLFVAIGISLALYGSGVFSRKKKQEETPANPIEDNPFTADVNFRQTESVKIPPQKEKKSRRALFLFGLGFGAMGIFVLCTGIFPLVNVRKSQNWVETPCVILRSEVTSHRGNDSTTYAVYTRYSYEWTGEKLIGEKYNFSSESNSNYDSKAAVVNLYPKGKKTVCYVNPDTPAEAVIVRSGGDMLWLPFVFGSAFTLMGIGIFTASFFIGKKKMIDKITADTPAPLRGSKTPGRKFLYFLFFSVIWNGIVIVFVKLMGNDVLHNGTIDWFLGGALTFFSLAGIGVIIAAIWNGLSALGPKLVVVMKPVLHLGETVPLLWRVSGNPGDIRLLKLSLVCVEKLMRESEETASQQEHPLDTLELLELRGPLPADTGELNVSVPLNALPCGDGDRVEIVWRVKAELRHWFWPKQRWEFSIEIVS